MTLVRTGQGVVEGYANWGRWVARCSMCGAGTPPGTRFGTPVFECVECGTVTEIIWPTEKMRQGVERLLMMRPNPLNRSWWPHETLHDLMRENAEHGIFDHLEAATPGQSLLTVTAAEIRTDRLPELVTPRRRAVEAR